MKIINETKKIVLAENANLADTPFKRIKGLLGRRSLEDREALIIKPCNSIHTFFMNFPIDALFVDSNNKVIKATTFLNPFRFTPIYFQSAYVIELPAGTILSSNTSTGDFLLLCPSSPV